MKIFKLKDVARLVAVLLSFVALFDCATSKQHEMLIGAVDSGNTAEVKTLLSAGADVNKKWNIHSGNQFFTNITPLMLAAKKGHTEIVYELLAQKKIDLNAPGDFNATPLMEAARNGHLEIVQALVDRGAEVNPRDSFGANL